MSEYIATMLLALLFCSCLAVYLWFKAHVKHSVCFIKNNIRSSSKIGYSTYILENHKEDKRRLVKKKSYISDK